MNHISGECRTRILPILVLYYPTNMAPGGRAGARPNKRPLLGCLGLLAVLWLIGLVASGIGGLFSGGHHHNTHAATNQTAASVTNEGICGSPAMKPGSCTRLTVDDLPDVLIAWEQYVTSAWRRGKEYDIYTTLPQGATQRAVDICDSAFGDIAGSGVTTPQLTVWSVDDYGLAQGASPGAGCSAE